MKTNLRHLSSALLFAAVPLAAVSCKKEDAAAPAASPGSSAASAAAAPASAAPVDASAWGFAAKLPRNTEGFLAFFNTASLVEGLLGSNWFGKIKSHPMFGPQVQQALSQMESDPQAKEVLGLVKEIAGKEIVLSLGEGTVSSFSKLKAVIAPVLQHAFKAAADGRLESQEVAPGVFTEMSFYDYILVNSTPEQKATMLNALADTDLPPLQVAVKAGAAREKIDAFFKQALSSLPSEVEKVLERGTFKVDGQEFQSLTFKIANIPATPESIELEMKGFASLLGSEEKAKALQEKVKAKTFAAAWGWSGDYLVLALGKDLSQVKLASGAESVLAKPEVSKHAGAWQAKKPFVFGHLSQSAVQALNGGSLLGLLADAVESSAGNTLVPVAPIAAGLRKLEKRATELWPNDADSLTTAAWWDGGVQAETFGGPKPRAFDSSKPLTFTAFSSASTFLSLVSRINEAERDKAFTFIEETCATLLEIWRKELKPGLPQEMAAQVGMGEAIGLPLVQGLWKGVQDFRSSLGAESALLVNLDGTMPPLPNVPEELKSLKIPRVLFASELKDRTMLATAWKGVGDFIGSVISLSNAPIKATPLEKKDGDLTVWGWELPIDLGDTWPHTGVAGDRWYFGTSVSLTKETSAKTATASGSPAGAAVRVNFAVLWDSVTTIMAAAPNAGPQEKEIAQSMIELVRAISELNVITSEDAGSAHTKVHLRISDQK